MENSKVKAAVIAFVVISAAVIANLHYQKINEFHRIAVEMALTQNKIYSTLVQIQLQGAK